VRVIVSVEVVSRCGVSSYIRDVVCVPVIVPIHKKGDKTECNNYRGISLLPTTYKILPNILLSRLIPYAEEIMGDYQCGFRRNR